LVITDTAASLDRVRNLILPQVDRKPKQVLIEARIMEVDRDKLRDIGVDWGTGSSGASGYKTAPGDNKVDGKGKETLAGRSLFSEFAPSIFGPKEGSSFTGSYPYSAGLELIFKKLTGYQFEVIIHALEEDVHTNTLSAPRILTLDNQEASILVGYHTPILKSELTAGTVTEGSKLTQTLDYYQEIGIRLNVVPQVNQDGYINMIIHPSITSSSTNVSATSFVGNSSTTTNYPIIDVRETQTQVLIKDEETIVIGGLLKDIKAKEKIGIPFLSKIPVLGLLFFRDTYDIVKMDLLIFITARILKDNEITAQELARLERSMAASNTVEIKRDLKAKKNIYKK
jgi:general secretion pathway protein D